MPTFRSVESSTAASRNRAAATNVYHGSPSLRRNLLDAAKTPDVGKKENGVNVASKVSTRQSTPSTSTPPVGKREKNTSRDSNASSSESPSKRSPLMNGVSRPPRAGVKRVGKGLEMKMKGKVESKQPTVGSRSGTFLKDEPTILKKSDMKTSQVT